MRPVSTVTLLLLAAVSVSFASPVGATPTDCVTIEVTYVGDAFDILTDLAGGSYFVAVTSDEPLNGLTAGALVTPALCKIEVDEVALGGSGPSPSIPRQPSVPVLP